MNTTPRTALLKNVKLYQVREMVEQALLPMRDGLRDQYEAGMNAHADAYARTMVDAAAEIKAAVSESFARGDNPVRGPKWITAAAYGRDRGEQALANDLAKHLSPYTLAARRYSSQDRRFYIERDSYTEGARLDKMTPAARHEEAGRDADASIQHAINEVCGKLAGCPATCTDSKVHGRTPNSFTLEITYASGNRVRAVTQMILNVSPRGKMFNQWPTRMYLAIPGAEFQMLAASHLKLER